MNKLVEVLKNIFKHIEYLYLANTNKIENIIIVLWFYFLLTLNIYGVIILSLLVIIFIINPYEISDLLFAFLGMAAANTLALFIVCLVHTLIICSNNNNIVSTSISYEKINNITDDLDIITDKTSRNFKDAYKNIVSGYYKNNGGYIKETVNTYASKINDFNLTTTKTVINYVKDIE